MLLSPEQRWIRWWTQDFWQQADSSWHHLPFFQLAPELRVRLSRGHQGAIADFLSVSGDLPGKPDERLLMLAQAPRHQLLLMVQLVSEICQHQSATELDEEQLAWCHRITKALRPGLWLPHLMSFIPPANQTAVLVLLAPLCPVAGWQRLRLVFDYHAVTQMTALENVLPIGKLQTLWDAVIWRSQQQSEQHYVDHPENYADNVA